MKTNDDDDETYKIFVIYVIETIFKINTHLIANRLIFDLVSENKHHA